MTRRLAACLAAACAVPLAPAAARAADPAMPMSLPGDASAASVRADPSDWIVGARPGVGSAKVARRFGARHIGMPQTGGYAVARSRARPFARALKARGLLVYAQPDTLSKPQAVPPDPLSTTPWDWRSRVASPSLTPPAVTPASPLLALVDAAADTTHPEWTNDTNFHSLGGQPVTNPHGTATAAVASAPVNGIGIEGVWPGARTLNVPLPEEISCSDSANGIARAIQAGAAVINMSYGSRGLCMPEYINLQFATGLGIIDVAAGGNDGESGSPLEFPASLPHVLTVAALAPNNRPAGFSNVSDAMDLSAPGVSIATAVPRAFSSSGYASMSGTSFAAPMVAAAAAWVRAARPTLRADQVSQVVRLSATNIGRKGWDQNTGFGLLNVGAALTRTAPPHDPTEPNDNIVWVNGRAFAKPDPPLWRGHGHVTLTAFLDRYEDPADVYRIVVPAHGAAHVSARLSFGDAELSVFKRNAVSILDRKRRVANSRRKGHKTERVTVHNRTGHARSFFVVLRPQGPTRVLDAGYVLRIR